MISRADGEDAGSMPGADLWPGFLSSFPSEASMRDAPTPATIRD
jgi:hypothetical protein